MVNANHVTIIVPKTHKERSQVFFFDIFDQPNENAMKKTLIYIVLAVFSLSAVAQKKITLDDIWKDYTFYAEGVYGVEWMKDGAYYSSMPRKENKIVRNSVKTGEQVNVIVDGDALKTTDGDNIEIDGYTFNTDETKVLLTTETEGIYRRSSKSVYYLYDIKSKKVQPLSTDKQMFATYSPDAGKVAFVKDNNLYYLNVADNKEVQITKDGKKNAVINGWCDWVYEEEFSFAKAFFWSPDGTKLAYYRFDETEVPEYNMQIWGELYPEDYRFKYPKAGEKNSVVEIKVYDLVTGKMTNVDVGQEKDQYIPRIKWTNTSDKLLVYRMNRLQNKLEILEANSGTGKTSILLKEEDPDAYVEIFDDTHFMKDGFILPSEKDGYKHLYYYGWDGKLINQITKGNWDVVSLVGVDEKKGMIYYSSAASAATQRDFYKVKLDGSANTKIAGGDGSHEIDMSPDAKYYIDTYSSANKPPVYALHDVKTGKQIRVLAENKKLEAKMKEYGFSAVDFFDFTTSEKVQLNGYMIKPSNFDKTKKYPVLMHVYGGPGINTVNNSWLGSNMIWHQMLAQNGYIVVSIDGRGTGYRGADFKKSTYGQLGNLESKDQIEGAKYLASLPYVDAGRIGIWGWSFGGYMTSLCMNIGADAFKAGIAVAPVTTWRYYDTIYTERYLGLPQNNAAGYDDNSPIQHADKLKGNYMLIHGTGDDNVHYQNAVDYHNALISAGKQFDSFHYPNRNHGIYGGNTRLHLYTMMTDFILENL